MEISKTKFLISTAIFPFLTNFSIIIFLINVFDIYLPFSHPDFQTSVALISILYIGGMIQFYSYGKSIGGWNELLSGSSSKFILFIILISYPVFYLFWLPFLIYRIIMFIGSPYRIWQNIFQDSCMSLLHIADQESLSKILPLLYSGIPFCIFATIYILIFVLLSPLWYLLFSPIGLGTLGICLNLSLYFPHSTEMDLASRLEKSFGKGTFIHVYIIALPAVIVSLIYYLKITKSWFVIFTLIFSSLHFIGDFYFSVFYAFN